MKRCFQVFGLILLCGWLVAACTESQSHVDNPSTQATAAQADPVLAAILQDRTDGHIQEQTSLRPQRPDPNAAVIKRHCTEETLLQWILTDVKDDFIKQDCLKYGSLEVSANIDQSTVYLDGVMLQTIDKHQVLRLNHILTGSHLLSAEADYCPLVSQNVQINEDQTSRLHFKLTCQYGSLQVSVNVDQADVYLDNRYVGEASRARDFIKEALPPGHYTVELKAKECQSQSKRVNISEEQTSRQDFDLTCQNSSLQVSVNVDQADVYLDNRYVGEASRARDFIKEALLPGHYTVELKAKECESQSKRVNISANSNYRTSFQLQCKKDYSRDRITGMPFVKVRGDSFRMGDLFNEGDSDEKSIRTVRVSDFWLGKHEVTQGEWLKVMGGSNPSYFQKGDDHPVEQVSWEMAQDFIKKLNQLNGLSCSGSFPYKSGCYRLPTEAEWEYACREGGRKVRFGNGSDTADPSQINFDGNWNPQSYSIKGLNRGHTISVKDLKPNSLGLYHMSGNVWEWVQDKYESDYSKIGTDNPIYTGSGDYRVNRGGSWYNNPEGVRCAYRNYDSPAYRSDDLGFRLARTD